jgi:hypothetical protein
MEERNESEGEWEKKKIEEWEKEINDISVNISVIEEDIIPESAVMVYLVALNHGDFEYYEFNPFITQAFNDDTTDNILFYSESFIAYDNEKNDIIKGKTYLLERWKKEFKIMNHGKMPLPGNDEGELAWPMSTNRVHKKNLFFENIENPISGMLVWLIDLEVIILSSYHRDVVLALYSTHKGKMEHIIRDINVINEKFITIKLLWNYVGDALDARPFMLEYLKREKEYLKRENDPKYKPILDIIENVKKLFDKEELDETNELINSYFESHFYARIGNGERDKRERDEKETRLMNRIKEIVIDGRELLKWFITTKEFKKVIDLKEYLIMVTKFGNKVKKKFKKFIKLDPEDAWKEWNSKSLSKKIVDFAMEITDMPTKGRDWFTLKRIMKLVEETGIRNVVLSIGSGHIESIRDVAIDLELDEWTFADADLLTKYGDFGFVEDFNISQVKEIFEYFKEHLLLEPLALGKSKEDEEYW